MLNWEDPLQATPKDNKPAQALPTVDVSTAPRQAHRTLNAGDGLVDNPTLMATAGAAPSVNPEPLDAVTPPAEAGATGLETLEMGAGRIRVDDKKIINCHADLNQLVPFKYEWAWQK